MLGARRGERIRALYGNRLVLFPPKKRPALTDLKLDRGLLIWAGVQVRRLPRHSSRIGLRGPDGATGRRRRARGPHHKIIAPQGQMQWWGKEGAACPRTP